MFCNNCGHKNPEDFKFCSACGAKRSDQSAFPERKEESPPVEENVTEIIELIVRAKSVHLWMENKNEAFATEVVDAYKKMVGAKNFSDIIFDIIFTTKRMLIRPASKVPLGVRVIALFALAQADTIEKIGRKMTSFLSASPDSLIGKPVDQDVASLLPSWRVNTIGKVKESLPGFLKNAITSISFMDEITIKNLQDTLGVMLLFEGSATPSKSTFSSFPSIAKLCSFDVSKIEKL